MAGMKVSELAKKLGYTNKELMAELDRLNIPYKSHATSLVDAFVDKVLEEVKPKAVETSAAEDEGASDASKAAVDAKRAEEDAAREAARIAAEERRLARKAIEAEREAARLAAEKAAAPAPAPEPEPVVVAAPEPVAAEAPEPEVEEVAAPATDSVPPVEETPPAEEVADEVAIPAEAEPATAEAEQVAPSAVTPADADVTPEAEAVDAIAAEETTPAVEVAAPAAEAPVEAAAPAAAAPGTKKLDVLESIRLAEQKLQAQRAEAAAEKKAARKRKDEVGSRKETGLVIETGGDTEGDRYSKMAQQAENKGVVFDPKSVLGQMQREVAAHQQEAASRGKKKKGKHGKGDADVTVDPQGADTSKQAAKGGGPVRVTEGVTVTDLADALEVPAKDIIKMLFLLGQVATLTQSLANEQIELIGLELEREITIGTIADEMTWTFEDAPEDLVPRSPVVTVMGHVDHGKTSLLDAIRETGVAETEAGGITQHIGASVVQKNGRTITFIDTPGHEAFTAMRARGANITDIVILVVAADDGVMPQTIEAINHAQAAGVPIVVAVNKIDKDGANPEQVRQMLTEYKIVPEEWGGTNIFVNVSAKKRLGIDELLEMLLLQADILELKANPNAPAFGTVIEAKLDKGRGPVATVLVQRGTLHVGESLVAGTAHGRVRLLVAPNGKVVKAAGPSEPVEIVGLASVPSAGDEFLVYAEEREAKSVAEARATKQRMRDQEKGRRVISLDDLFSTIQAGDIKDLNLIVKADVQGSIEALSDALAKMDQSEVRINIIHGAVGGVTETDIQFAVASNAIVIGFNVRPTPKAKAMAADEGVDVRLYRVIYQAIEEINAARVGMLSPESVDTDTGQAEVRDLFRVPKAGIIAGCYILDGEINRDDRVRVVRDGTIVFEGTISSLRRFKEDVKTVKRGFECGIGIANFQDLKAGDIIEGFRTEQVAREE